MEQVPKRVVVAEFIIGRADAQHGGIKRTESDILSRAKILVDSTKPFGVPVYILTNGDIDHQSPELVIQQQEIPTVFAELPLYYLRWMMAYQFLFSHPEIEEAAFVDLGDVEMLHNPFGHFEENTLYFSDEDALLTGKVLVQGPKPKYAADFLEKYRYLKMLDPGVIAGYRSILLEYLGIVSNTIAQTAIDVKAGKESGLQALEMAIINYVAYRYFPNRIRHGRQVSTVVFQNRANDHSWFKHK